VRKSSQVLMGAISLVSVAAGVQVGAQAKSSNFSGGTTIPTSNPTVTPAPTTTSGGGGSTSTPKPTKTSGGGSTSTPTPTQTTPANTGTVSHTSSPVYYRYGTVQLTVTKQGSQITNIVMDQAGATAGRAAAFPYLIQLAEKAQSASFDTSMMGGATFSTDAFMQALGDALSQF
jgi:uncharacterized protein with FMN-binding domain